VLNKSFILTVLFVVAAFCSDLPGNAGTCSFAFLKILKSPRAESMGGISVALNPEEAGVLENPANLPYLSSQVSVSYRNLWSLSNNGVVGYNRPLGESSALGAFLYFNSYGKVQGMDVQGNETNTFSPMDLVIGSTYSARHGRNISYGLTGKFIYQSASSLSSFGLAMDLGALYRIPKKRAHLVFLFATSEPNYPLFQTKHTRFLYLFQAVDR
jgi:hypothetical protein